MDPHLKALSEIERGAPVTALSDFKEGLDTPTLSPFTRSKLTTIRALVRVGLEDLNDIRDVLPEDARDTIGHALLTVQGECSALIGDEGGE